MSGAIAVLCLPDDQRLHVQLSPYFYASTLAKLRRDILADRSGWAVVELATPVTSPVIEVALDRRTAYVLGFRLAGRAQWWAFQDRDKPLPRLPGGPCRWSGLSGSYAELGLPASINMRPDKLLNLLAAYDGRPDPQFCRAVVLLLFLVAEALRFDSVLMECVAYFSQGAGTANTLHPGALGSVVKNWAKAPAGDRNLLVAHLGQPPA